MSGPEIWGWTDASTLSPQYLSAIPTIVVRHPAACCIGPDKKILVDTNSRSSLGGSELRRSSGTLVACQSEVAVMQGLTLARRLTVYALVLNASPSR